MEIIEGNKLIAEFMGGEFERKRDAFEPDRFNETFVFLGGQGNPALLKDPARHHYPVRTLAYHAYWDWLMPVVEKIEDCVVNGYLFSIKITNSYCEILRQTENFEGLLLSRESNSKITATWKAVVAFIQWYNQQKEAGFLKIREGGSDGGSC